MVPVGRVEAATREQLPALDGRIGGPVQLTGGHHHGIGLPRAAIGAGHAPAAGVLIPGAGHDLGVGNDEALDVELAGHPVQVVEDLALW